MLDHPRQQVRPCIVIRIRDAVFETLASVGCLEARVDRLRLDPLAGREELEGTGRVFEGVEVDRLEFFDLFFRLLDLDRLLLDLRLESKQFVVHVAALRALLHAVAVS